MIHVLYKRPGAWVVAAVAFLLTCLPYSLDAQLLVQEDFTGYSTGSLAGQGSWVNKNQVNLVINVANSSPITSPCYNGGGGNYAVPAAGGLPNNQRLQYTTPNFVANTDQSFYVAFLLNVSNAGTDPNAHILGLGNDFGGTDFEFVRVHVQSAGAGFTIGISEGNGTGLGGNSGGGIEWSGTVYNLNQTYVVLVRYDYDNAGGANADALRLWVDPLVGTQPSNGSANAVIAGGARSNDVLFDGDNVRNLYLNYRGAGSPTFQVDAIRYSRGSTPAAAWANLAAGSDSNPTVSTTATAVSTLEDTPVALSVTISDAVTPVGSLVVTASSGNPAVVPNSGVAVQSSPGATRSILVTPAANANGVAPIIVTVTDECGNSATTTLTLTVQSVNDVPSFSTGANVAVSMNSSPYSAPFATGINDGDPEAVQSLTFLVNNNNNALFSVQPSINGAGTLTFTPAANAMGVAVVSVALQDNGGTANGGVNTSPTQNFTITVLPPIFTEDFTGYAPGSLSGQGGWFGKNVTNLVINVANSTPLQYAGCYNGGGGNYATPVAGDIPYNQRIAHTTANFVANTDQVFYTSFLLNLSSAGTDANAHILGLGNDFGGTDYEFLRVHVRSAGAGFNVGISEGGGTGLAVNSGGGIEWGASVLALNQTYLIVARYEYDNGGPLNADNLRLWVNPSLASEPSNGSAEADIIGTERGNDILFDGDNVRNIYLNYRGAGSPVYRIDGIRYTRGNTSAFAWTALNAVGAGSAPTVTTTATAVSTFEDTPTTLSVLVNDDQIAPSALVVTASSGNPSVVSTSGIVVLPSAGASRSISVTPVTNANGVVPITVTVTDPCGGVSTTSFTLTVNPVNDEPSFSTGGNIVADALGGPYSAPFATNINDGDPEATQTLTFTVSNNNNALFTVQPSISPSGVLSFTPSTTANGTAVVSVFLTDNGGTANGGDNTSPTQTFTITVAPINGFYEDFTGYAPGSLAGQDSWVGKNQVNLVIDVANSAPITYPCYNGGGGNYATPVTGGTPFNQRIQRTTPAYVAGADQVFYLSFLLNLSNAGTDPDAHIVGLGNDFGGTDFEFLRIHARPSGAGFNIGISEGNGTGLGGNSGGGIEWGSGVYNLNQTYLIIARYDYDHAGGVNNDVARLWVNPGVVSEPAPVTAEVDIHPGERGNDILFDGDNIRNLYLNYRGSGSPVYKIDGIHYVRGANSATAWANLGASASGDSAPVVSTTATAVSTVEDAGLTLSVTVSDAQTPTEDIVVTAFTSDPTIVSTSGIVVQNSTGASRSITVTPVPNANGVVTITVAAADQCATGTTTFTLTVLPVNDEPSFSTGANVVVDEDNGPYNAPFGTGISDNDPEVAQTLTFNVSNNNNALFSAQPSIDPGTGNLSFTPAVNAHGVAVVSVFLTDDGGTANGGDDTSPTQQFTITVNSVNDEPSFSTGANVVVNEDNGPYDAAFATGISDNDPEVVQTLTFNVSNDNNSLFSVQPGIDVVTGNLSFTPAANANGVAVVSVFLTDDGGTANGGDDTSPTQQFTITVNSVNDEPSFSTGANVTVDEDSGPYNASFATGMSDNDPEVMQALTFNVSNDNNALFSAQPSIDPGTGNLSFTPAANANGVAVVSVYLTDDGGTANGGDDTSPTQQFTITVNSINDEPTFSTGANVTVNEDNGPYDAPFATGIDDGDPEVAQTLTFDISNDNNALFSVQPSIDVVTGNLSFTPAANANGVAVVSVFLTDDGGTANGGDDTSPTQQFTITVNSVNDEPSFSTGANVVVNEDSGAYDAPFATGISDNDPEVAQTLTFTVSNDNNALFSVQPGIDVVTGNLSFTPAANANGVAVVSVYLTDDGGTANGGDDTSPTQQFTITVNSVNDEPSFSTGANVTVNEDSGAYNAAFATGISDNDPEVVQTLTFNVSNDNNALFSAQPSIDPGTGNLSFTPAANAHGVAVVSVFLSDDGGTANGGDDTSPTQQFTITVNSVNDEPSFSTGANVVVNEDSGAYNAGFATGISDNDPEVVQTLTFNVSNNNNALFSVQPSIDVVTGNLSFTPAANANGVAVVSVVLTDDGGTANGGDDTSPTQQFTITVNFVNDAPTFTTGANVTVFDINGPYNAPFATGINDGDPEVTQTLTFTVSNNNNALFTVQPDIDELTGNLSFTPALGANGQAVVTVTLMDNGGTANGGVNSTTKQFTITVVRFNTPPVAVPDAASTCTGTPVVIAVLANDTDADMDALAISSVTQPANGTVVILPGNTTVRYTPPAAFAGTTTFTYTASDGKGGSSTATVTVTVNPITVNVKVLLEGPYTNNGQMSTLLQQQGYIPLTSPYPVGGTVSSIPSGAVDWILVEFRTNTNSASTVLRKAGFLKYDGTIMGANGNTLTVTAAELPAGNYYIVVRHRNHLDIMSSNRATVSNCGISWNFTTSQSQAYSTLQTPMYRVQLSPAYYAMKSADPTGDEISTAFDRVMIVLNLFDTGYEASDMDLDGDVDLVDVLIIQKHLFQFSQVP